MRIIVLISIISCRLKNYTCCMYRCMECYESAQPAKKKKKKAQHWPHWPYQAIGEKRLKLKYSSTSKCTLNKVWWSKCSSCFFVVVETSQCG